MRHTGIARNILGYSLLLQIAATSPAATAGQVANLAELSQSLEALSERISPAVVEIRVTAYGPVGENATTANLLARRRNSGSGVILDPDGYIVTNAHVVRNARRVQVLLAAPTGEKKKRRSILKPKGKLLGAQIVGVDAETDLAVLKIQEKQLPYLTLGDSDTLRQGQIVLAFGSPLGLENSVTMGVVSAVARQIQDEDRMIYIQTDASINPGNSGGPLVAATGEIVGINTLIFSQSGGNEGLGFAAPSNIVRNIYRQIRQSGRVRRGELGAVAQTITPLMAEGLGLAQYWGVLLGDVVPGRPAANAGLRIGDIVKSLDGKVMENGRQFDVNLYRRSVGERVRLEILRGKEEMQFEVPVAERIDDSIRFAAFVTPERNLVPELGILGLDLDNTTRALLPVLRKESGVIVAALSAQSPADEGIFRPGDVIHAVNRKSISSLEELRSWLNRQSPYTAIVVQIERLGQFLYVAFELE